MTIILFLLLLLLLMILALQMIMILFLPLPLLLLPCRRPWRTAAQHISLRLLHGGATPRATQALTSCC